jgi:hypothetical protein
MIVCIVGLILSAGPAFAQMGAEGGGGSGARGGRGGSRDQKKEKPKRNEQSAVDPATSRQKLASALAAALGRGAASTPYLLNLFEQASTQAIPASLQSRKALADALSDAFKGKKLESANAEAIADPISSAINMDGMTPDELSAKKDPLKQALGTGGMSEEQVATTLTAFDAVIADQQNEAVRKVAEDLENIQKDGQAGDDLKTLLATNLGALADESNKPSDQSLSKLAESFTKGLDSAQLTNKEKAQVAFELQSIFNNPDATPVEFNASLNQLRMILKAGLVKTADVQLVATEVQAIHKSQAGSGAEPGAR